MASNLTIFEQCSTEFDVTDNVAGLLECLSDKHTETTDGLTEGLDTFFLIFAGALVYFMQTGFAVSSLQLACLLAIGSSGHKLSYAFTCLFKLSCVCLSESK